MVLSINKKVSRGKWIGTGGQRRDYFREVTREGLSDVESSEQRPERRKVDPVTQ
jgi:hypothetical protein